MNKIPGNVPQSEEPLNTDPLQDSRVGTFASLHNRNFLWYWLGQIASFMGLQMGIVARGWLVWIMTGSELYIGIVSFAFGLPILLFSLFGGAIADKLPKRNLLIGAQLFQAVIALAIAFLVASDEIEFWHLVMAAFGNGLIFVFNGPARQAIIPDLIKKDMMLNAISLNSAGINFTRIAGPAIAGLLIAPFGIDGVYFTTVGFYLISMFTFIMISLPITQKKILKPESFGDSWSIARSLWVDLVAGLRYLRNNSTLIWLLVMALIPLFFGLPYMNLLPVFADEVLGVGEVGFGLLMACQGIGALSASLGLASLGNYKRKGILLMIFSFAFGLALAIFTLSETYVISLGLLLIVGAFNAGYTALNNTLLQSNADREMLGRVMSLHLLTFAAMPLGTLPIGALAEIFGIAHVVFAGGILIMVFTTVMAMWRPVLRRLE